MYVVAWVFAVATGSVRATPNAPNSTVYLAVNPNPSTYGQSVAFTWSAGAMSNQATCDDNVGWLVHAPPAGTIYKTAGVHFSGNFTWRVACADDITGASNSIWVMYNPPPPPPPPPPLRHPRRLRRL